MLIEYLNRWAKWRNKAARENISYRVAKNFGVLYQLDQNFSGKAIDHLVDSLKKDGKTVDILVFDINDIEKKFNHFYQKDYSIFGYWKNENVKDYYEKSFDFLINPDDTIHPLMENILINSKAKCRIGMYTEDEKGLFEMMIKCDHSQEPLNKINSIFNYLKLIN